MPVYNVNRWAYTADSLQRKLPRFTRGRARCSLRWREDSVEDDKNVDTQDQSCVLPGADDARVVVDFAIGPSGVGPVMGFDSDDFFPSAPDAGIDRNRTD